MYGLLRSAGKPLQENQLQERTNLYNLFFSLTSSEYIVAKRNFLNGVCVSMAYFCGVKAVLVMLRQRGLGVCTMRS